MSSLRSLAPILPAAIVAGVGVGVGLWSVAAGLRHPRAAHHRSESVLLRVASTLSDVSAEARKLLAPTATDPVTVFGRIAHPALVALSERVDQIFGGEKSTARLVARAGHPQTVADYRVERLVWAGVGVAFALIVLAPTVIQSPAAGVLPAVIGAGVGAGVGAWFSDQRLHSAAKKRHQELLDQFPTMVELLSLTLAAGQSLPNALERVARQAGGALGEEWRRVLAQVDLGAPLGPTLRDSADQMAVPEISALVDHLVYALERGSPLADIVRSHSTDARADRLRGIVERSGKAEIAMLVPLVLLILPVTVLFAVYPGLQALQMGF
jgi:tight adherence protein C